MPREPSSPYALDNREVSFGGNDAPKPGPRSLQQVPELRLGALSAMWREHQYLKIRATMLLNSEDSGEREVIAWDELLEATLPFEQRQGSQVLPVEPQHIESGIEQPAPAGE